MFGFGKNKNVVKVKFYDQSTETPFLVSKVPIEQLPDTFEIDTTMYMGEDEWLIQQAEPAEKAKFRESGKLDLYVLKSALCHIDPDEALYSLPTICHDIAMVENADSMENVVVFREDDWRQFEFLSTSHEANIKEEFDSIRNTYDKHREGVGFTKLHLRDKIKAPFEQSALTLSALEGAFDIAKKYNGVAFNNAAATLVFGFAAQTKTDWLLWGQADDSGTVLAMNISPTPESKIANISDQIDSFIEKNDLYLINWPKLFWCGQGKSSFASYVE